MVTCYSSLSLPTKRYNGALVGYRMSYATSIDLVVPLSDSPSLATLRLSFTCHSQTLLHLPLSDSPSLATLRLSFTCHSQTLLHLPLSDSPSLATLRLSLPYPWVHHWASEDSLSLHLPLVDSPSLPRVDATETSNSHHLRLDSKGSHIQVIKLQ